MKSLCPAWCPWDDLHGEPVSAAAPKRQATARGITDRSALTITSATSTERPLTWMRPACARLKTRHPLKTDSYIKKCRPVYVCMCTVANCDSEPFLFFFFCFERKEKWKKEKNKQKFLFGLGVFFLFPGYFSGVVFNCGDDNKLLFAVIAGCGTLLFYRFLFLLYCVLSFHPLLCWWCSELCWWCFVSCLSPSLPNVWFLCRKQVSFLLLTRTGTQHALISMFT